MLGIAGHSRFTFNHVEYLEITNNYSENYENLLTSFDFPDVKTLKLDLSYCGFNLISQQILNQVHSKHPKLERFILYVSGHINKLFKLVDICLDWNFKKGFIINNGRSLEDKQVYYYKTNVSSLKDKEMKSVIDIVDNKFFSNVQINKDSPNEKMLVELWYKDPHKLF
ncbi:hypothetical protein F8M41_005055 [Gigaspora margarita]|uniref:Uncharacterized protein n=1 Tax=Gigaspora margarita TaxID=4874 RepID=A0A8H3X8Q7_GIGMA|nr:hypothetical protein F8M41_005055 [Gigaspora margarita]